MAVDFDSKTQLKLVGGQELVDPNITYYTKVVSDPHTGMKSEITLSFILLLFF